MSKSWYCLKNGVELKIYIYPLPSFLTLLLLIPFTTKEITGCTNEAVKSADKAPGIRCSCFFILYFTVSVTSSINPTESTNYLMILIILFISSLEIDKVNPFPTPTAPFTLLLLSFFYSDSSFYTYFSF